MKGPVGIIKDNVQDEDYDDDYEDDVFDNEEEEDNFKVSTNYHSSFSLIIIFVFQKTAAEFAK